MRKWWTLVLLLASESGLGLAANSTDDWSTLARLQLVQDLPECARSCVIHANEKVSLNSGLRCQSYGCVCAESTQGLNFQYALGNVTECAQSSCSSDIDVETARLGFQDLCVVYVANSTQPEASAGTNITRITSRDYRQIHPCAKFALNGCLNEYGNRNEPDCGPVNELEHWEEYRGVAAQRKCDNAQCLCKKPFFNATFAAANKAAELYCNMYISTEALPNEKWEAMVNVIATFCAAAEHPPRDWWLEISGVPVNTSSSNQKIQTQHQSGWSTSDKIQVGFGAGVGIPGLFLTALCVWIS